ncbi:hypothetical protein CPT76_08075 [Paenibacillus sp. AR247]|nr:hypothetical protein CPT76_08075 [Paenibacillus sp. AR247]
MVLKRLVFLLSRFLGLMNFLSNLTSLLSSVILTAPFGALTASVSKKSVGDLNMLLKIGIIVPFCKQLTIRSVYTMEYMFHNSTIIWLISISFPIGVKYNARNLQLFIL